MGAQVNTQEPTGHRSTEAVAIVGIGLTYPDAGSPGELWENVLAGRRAFRRLPDERMNRADYHSADPHAPDRFYADRAAVLRDWSFDRVAYKIAGSTFRSTDTTHWLALDVAARALADAGFPDGEGLPRRTTGVVLGNSLTGEFSRANVMRLRWPYVRRTVAAALAEEGWTQADVARFLHSLQARYKAPFPMIDEDTLAGGLANTIAGRICNHFDLAGGGYTVDGACSSSLLSVVTAANALVERDLDVAVAGGVDLSIDPFEVIGFAKTGALASGEMKVYDAGSNGFWPGEGAGALVLMRESDAVAQGSRIYASITGWGVSSDGKGGMTRPEADGHRLALERAYRRAGYGVETVSYFEGHGTGTALGDATEIAALSGARRDAAPSAAPAALGTVKGNFGHTKAAAGVAGLIKAALSVYHQVIPPITGNSEPHALLTGDAATMYLPRAAELWPAGQEIRAGVSAMGFGGINSHVTMQQAPGAARRDNLDEATRALVAGRQDVELLLFDADDQAALRDQVAQLTGIVGGLATAELTDLAGALAGRLGGRPVRAAIVAGSPDEAERGLSRLLAVLDSGSTESFGITDGVFLATTHHAPRIGYLFPGQGAGRGGPSALPRRFAAAAELHATAALPVDADRTATQVAQPRIVSGSLAGLRVLRALGVEASVAVGHSLGELTALHWAGAMDETQVLELARVRGRVMAELGGDDGAMAGLALDATSAAELAGDDAVIAGYNGPEQTVVSGTNAAIERICARARVQGVSATRLAVSHAFHSPAVAPAAAALIGTLEAIEFGRLQRPVVSTVTGDVLHGAEDLAGLLRDQIVLPVRFREAATQVAGRCGLLIEVGPGRTLTGLAGQIAPETPAIALDTDSPSLAPLLRVLGAAFVAGAALDVTELFAGRAVRPLPLDGSATFLTSPCEAAPAIGAELAVEQEQARPRPGSEVGLDDTGSTLELLRTLAAARVELPLEALTADTHPLDDLHLSSITVGQIVNDVTRALGQPALEGMPNFATVCLGELAEMIDELAQTERPDDAGSRGEVPGVAEWVRPFAVTHVRAPRPVVDVGTGTGRAEWTAFAPAGHPLAEPLREALAGAGVGDGVLLCLPADADESHFGLFLQAGRTVLAAPSGTRFVLVQQGLGASGLARTLRLEDPSTRTTIVELPDVMAVGGIADSVACVVAETAATPDYVEARYDADGDRWVPALGTVADLPQDAAVPLGPDDVLLVTGGGKGITAECALAVAAETGSALLLLGRSVPADDAELTANLARMAAAGVRHRYEQADVTSAEQVDAAVRLGQAALGPVTAVLHGAGRNEPGALFSLTEESFRSTAAPKISGLRAVLAAVDPEQIRLLVTFGSIIGRAGLRGEAHYATANDWMSELTLRFGREHPRAKVLAVEWSVWSGAGMGEKLGVVSALQRDGITPIPTAEGIAVLRRLLADPAAPPVTVVCGRTSGLPTLPVERTELPLHRFVDRVVVHYPGIELVTEADLTAGSDPYLNDHRLDGDLLFPAVLGMEAMTQVAAATASRSGVPALTDVEFLRPIVVAAGRSTTIRIAALAVAPGVVDVVIRSEETGFGADHFRARLHFDRPEPTDEPDRAPLPGDGLPAVPCDPVGELYGTVLFQGKLFQRLMSYRHVAARAAVAEVSAGDQGGWFAGFLPQDMLLADPGTRDVMMHAIQCCIPDATLLPQGVQRLDLARRRAQDVDHVVLVARERSQDGDSYVYDVDVRDPDGRLVERWTGLMLRAVRKRGGAGPWVPSMLGPHLERELEPVLGGRRAVVVEPDRVGAPARTTEERRSRTELAAGRSVGRPLAVRHRPDGRPEVDGRAISASHSAGLTVVVTGPAGLACDAETVVPRSEEDWAGLLGADLLAVRDLLAREGRESTDTAATRVWSALECVRKTGSSTQTLTLHSLHPGGWALLSAGPARVATWVTRVEGRPDPVVFAILATKED